MNILNALKEAYEVLKKNEIDTYMLDSQVILAHLLETDRLYLTLNREEEISDEVLLNYKSMIELRAEKMPVKYITNSSEFMGLDFYIENGVLIPRPDTEILVEEVIKRIREKKYVDICDVCCGSGAIGLSIAHYENVNMDMVDISPIAIKVSTVNRDSFKLSDRVSIKAGDLLENQLKEGTKYQCVVSNPPYIEKAVIDTLMKDVKEYEPHLALDGGEDGLYFYRKITKQAVAVLEPGGMLAYEIGHDQRESVSEILRRNGFVHIETFKDYGNNDRVVLGYKIP